MKIEANDKEVRDIFSLGYFKIPRFQRPYSWGEEEVNNFWDDVVYQNHEHYFIGSMVVYEIKKPFLGIVDGQQRLTTITLMLAAIRNAFNKYGETDLAKGVHYFIEKADIDNKNIFILDSETSFPYLQSHIQSFKPDVLECSVGNEEQKLKIGFEIVNSKLLHSLSEIEEGQQDSCENEKAINMLKSIRDRVLSLKLVFIQLDNEEEAYLIFETLNTRGRDLTTPDLVKNLLLKKLKNNQVKYDSPKLIWNEILELFDENELDTGMKDFLYHYWLSKYKYTTEKKLFGEIKGKILSEKTASLLLQDLKGNSKYYTSIVAPQNHIWTKEEYKIRDVLLSLKLFRVKQHTPMTLSLRRAYKEKKITLKEFYNVLKAMESFHFIFNAVTQQRSSGSISAFYTRHARALSYASSHSEIQIIFDKLKLSLTQKRPEYNEFEAGFSNIQYLNRKTRSKNLLKYILSRFLLEVSTGVSIDLDAMTIEHLLPQSKITDENELQIGSIGNLILIDAVTNSEELKNHTFEKKKEILIQKKYPLEEYILQAETWDAGAITKRTKNLCEIAYYQLWKI